MLRRFIHALIITSFLIGSLTHLNATRKQRYHTWCRCVSSQGITPCKLSERNVKINGKVYKLSSIKATILIDGKLNLLVETKQ